MTEKPHPARSEKLRQGSVVRAGNESLPIFAPVPLQQSPGAANSKVSASLKAPSDSDPPGQDAANSHRGVRIVTTSTRDQRWDRIGKLQTGVDLDSLTSAINQTQQQQTESLPATIREQLKRNRRPLSSFFTSLLVHVSLLVSLMLIVLSIPDREPRISVLAEFDANPIFRDLHDVQSEKVKIELSEENNSPIEMIADDVSLQQELQLADNPNKALNSISKNDVPSTNLYEAPVRPNQLTMPSGGGLEGRESNAPLAWQRLVAALVPVRWRLNRGSSGSLHINTKMAAGVFIITRGPVTDAVPIPAPANQPPPRPGWR